MPGDDKPYRVYRGGRQKGKVPLQTRPARARARTREDGGKPRYRGPGPARPEPGPNWRRRVALGFLVLVVLFVLWAIGSYLSVQSGIHAANKRLQAGSTEALTRQNSLILSSPTDILVLGSDHAQ